MKLQNTKVGIWGLGVVGKAAVSFLYSQGAVLTVCDNRQLTPEEEAFLTGHTVLFMPQQALQEFLDYNDIIIASPGISIASYHLYSHKFVTELDLFYSFCTVPIIAITGSVGKTTVTSLLAHYLEQCGVSVIVGGNIGTAAFSLLHEQHNAQFIVLEVSSFQLEHCKSFAPDLAIITNIYSNHLDRHSKYDDYVKAKINILIRQKKQQQALIPLSVAPYIPVTLLSSISFFSDTESLSEHNSLFFMKNNSFWFSHNNVLQRLYDTSALPPTTFIQNWLIITAALRLLGHNNISLAPSDKNTVHREHRLEKIGTIDGIDFYNDSKATIPAATWAAVTLFEKKPIHLFLGGLSKGVDRSHFIAQLMNRVSFIYCFGAEALSLYDLCLKYAIPAQSFNNLDDAFHACITRVQADDIVLFSPSGSSFDLFNNYQERGAYFKKLVHIHAAKKRIHYHVDMR